MDLKFKILLDRGWYLLRQYLRKMEIHGLASEWV